MAIEQLEEVKINKKIDIGFKKTCDCSENHLNCLTPKEWLKSQIGVWQFYYEKRDIRNKKLHPATFPIALARKCIELFTHKGELVIDPFVGSGTTLVAARDTNRNAVGFDLNKNYIDLAEDRLSQQSIFNDTKQIAICDDARNIPEYLERGTIKLVLTSPPYANLLNRKRKNKSRRGDLRRNEQYDQIEQYSQDDRDLGVLSLNDYAREISSIFAEILPLLRPTGHCVINVGDMWLENERIPIHISIIEALQAIGFKFRNTIIWDRTNIVNRVGIFGWPSNYITMGTTFEYLLHFIPNEKRL
ncbi:modification methylase HindIII [bacterium BMS3Abin05]|nr:modification methylase HindIII [bacterium BMS3Abin05]GBE27025.1 modification methylase HindIII [bacterium BMS3Bbin03]